MSDQVERAVKALTEEAFKQLPIDVRTIIEQKGICPVSALMVFRRHGEVALDRWIEKQ